MKELEKEMKQNSDAMRLKVHVVGCKSDLDVSIGTKMGIETWAKKNGYEFYEVSNMDGFGVNNCFFNLFLKVLHGIQREKDRLQL